MTNHNNNIRNGKEYSDACFTCGESKAAVKHSQSIKDPIYCVTGSDTECGFEVDQEYDRHRFTRTLKQKAAEEADEMETIKQMGDFAEFQAKQETP